MNVDDLSSESVDHADRHCDHEARENDQVRIRFLQLLKQSEVELLSVLKVLGRYTDPFDPRLLRPGQGVSVPVVADHADDLRIYDLSARYGVDDRLEIRASSGYANGNSQHNSTPFCEPLTTSPIT